MFSPGTRSVPPSMSTVAPASVASATTVTSVTPLSRFTVWPFSTASPLIVNVARVASCKLGNTTFTMKVDVEPSSAVTTTLTSLLP